MYIYPEQNKTDCSLLHKTLSKCNKNSSFVHLVPFKSEEELLNIWCCLIPLFVESDWTYNSVSIVFSGSVPSRLVISASQYLWRWLRNSDMASIRDTIYYTGKDNSLPEHEDLLHGTLNGCVNSTDDLIDLVF